MRGSEAIATPNSSIDRAKAPPCANICSVQDNGNKWKQVYSRKCNRITPCASNEQDLSIQRRLSDYDGVCIKGIELEHVNFDPRSQRQLEKCTVSQRQPVSDERDCGHQNRERSDGLSGPAD